MAKHVAARPEWLHAPDVADICSVSDCFSEAFADYISFWAHNGYWLFNSPTEIAQVAKAHDIDLTGTTLLYYEAFETEFDGETGEWTTFEPDASFDTRVELPSQALLLGYDVATFNAGNSPECSPLSCNSKATELPVNSHCLFAGLDEAVKALEAGSFAASEPGPYRILAVYKVDGVTAEAPPNWRRPPLPLVDYVVFLLICFWATLVFALEMDWAIPLAWAAAFIGSLVVLFAIRAAWWWLRRATTRRTPPIDCPPPPVTPQTSPKGRFQRLPRPNFPPAAHARGQFGWVALRVKVGRNGRIKAYVIIDQAPVRMFERAVVAALCHAKSTKGHPTEEYFLFKFVPPVPPPANWANGAIEGGKLTV